MREYSVIGYDTNAVPDFAGALLEDAFFWITISHDEETGEPQNTLSGWQSENLTARCRKSRDVPTRNGLLIESGCACGAGWMYKAFPFREGGELCWHFRFTLFDAADGMRFSLTDGDFPVLCLEMRESRLCSVGASGEETPLFCPQPGESYGVSARLKLDAGTARVLVDGCCVAENVLLDGRRVDGFRLDMPGERPAKCLLSYLRVDVGYAVWETLAMTRPGRVPYGWCAEGEVTVAAHNGGEYWDPNGFLMQPGAALQRRFAPIASCRMETALMFPERPAEGSGWTLLSGEKPALTLAVQEGRFVLKTPDRAYPLAFSDAAGHPRELTVRSDLWYAFCLDWGGAENGLTLYVNYIPVLSGLAVPCVPVEGLRFTAAGTMWADNVAVCVASEYPADYPTAPRRPEKSTAALVEMQYCPCWQTGFHNGWNHHYRWPVLETALGYYDEGAPEVMDWQIKWMAERGVDFIFYDWYQTYGKPEGVPLQFPLYNKTFTSHFYARYAEKMGVALQVWGPYYSVEDYKKSVIPYWLHYYFLNPRYVVVDNRPLLGIGEPEQWAKACGGIDAARELLQYLDRVCREAGFDGICVVACLVWEHLEDESFWDNPKQLKAMGFDGIFAYTYGTSANAVVQTALRREQELTGDVQGAASRMSVLPVVCSGWNLRPNFPSRCTPVADHRVITAEELEEQCRWLVEEYMPSLSETSLGRKLVLVDNWNEYTEGHGLCPGYRDGFARLNVVGRAFTQNGAFSTDSALPNRQQKLRMNFNYPPGWVDGRVWQFDSFCNEPEFWYPGEGLRNVRTDGNGHLVGEIYSRHGITDTAVTLTSIQELGIAAEASHLTIRMQTACALPELRVYFATDDRPIFSEEAYLSVPLHPGQDFVEYRLDGSEHPLWTGRIYQLRLDFCARGYYRVGESVQIDYIMLTK